MSLQSQIKISGKLTIKKYNSENVLLEKIEIPNLVVNTGKAFIVQRIINNTEPFMSHMALGRNANPPLASNAVLGSEQGRVAFESIASSATDILYTAIFPAGVATGTIAEAGIFNDPLVGTMLCRTTFSPLNKLNTEYLVIAWTITVG